MYRIEYKGIVNSSVSVIMGQVPRIMLTTSIIGSLIASPLFRITHARDKKELVAAEARQGNTGKCSSVIIMIPRPCPAINLGS